jgi:predicted dehydrogenase
MATTAHYPGGTERIEVIGTLGTAVLEGGHLRVDFINGDDSIEVTAEGGTGGGANIMDFPHDWHRDLISDFVASVHQQRPSRTHGGEALQTHQLIDDLLAAAGQVVKL